MQENEITEWIDGSAVPKEDIKKLFKLFLDSRKETEITKRELHKLDSIKDVMIQEITGKYKFYEFFFDKIFSERRDAIRKDFEIIDKGMKENNRDLINSGVAGLSQIVSASPFTDMERLKRLIDNF